MLPTININMIQCTRFESKTLKARLARLWLPTDFSYQVRRYVGERLHHPAPQFPDIPQLDGVVHGPRRQQVSIAVESDRRQRAPLQEH